ncbi:hypothetical protein RHSIM_Rhsim08G0237700 [Rhododendron simsii]|uniref:Uncharacterized protein n=1 Tax=Rhododendron simsii TaxID=118357 RepID=A0A834GFU9_RHOSS|nr:hypothetical protein RHSIM_Rhsim08G0237700 [Rhododendron simsii]
MKGESDAINRSLSTYSLNSSMINSSSLIRLTTLSLSLSHLLVPTQIIMNLMETQMNKIKEKVFRVIEEGMEEVQTQVTSVLQDWDGYEALVEEGGEITMVVDEDMAREVPLYVWDSITCERQFIGVIKMSGDSHEDMALPMHHAWAKHASTVPFEETPGLLESWPGGQPEFQRDDESAIFPWLPWTQLQRETRRIVVYNFETDATREEDFETDATREEDFNTDATREEDFDIDATERRRLRE